LLGLGIGSLSGWPVGEVGVGVEETKGAVGRRRDGSSASVSVSPAQSWPGAVDIVFTAAAVREWSPVMATVPAAGYGEAPPWPQEVYMGGRLPRRFL
jgi:hypothetical protein